LKEKVMNIRIPAQWEPHACCWMAWAVHSEWGKAINKVKRELSEVIQTVAEYEPVRVLARRGQALREARQEFAFCPNVTVIDAPVDDIWMRDIAPTFAVRGGHRGREVVAIDWNFNGWGGSCERPARAGDRLAKTASSIFGVPRVSVPFVADPNGIIPRYDGKGITHQSAGLALNGTDVGRPRGS